MGPLASIFRPVFAVLLFVSLTFSITGVALPDDEEGSPAPSAPPAEPAPERPRYRLEPIVVTPDRLPIRLDRVPSDVTVITQGRLEARRPPSLSDALRLVPGIDVQRAGTLGKLTDVRLRGADPRHTLVLYDGIPLNGPWLGSFDFADLTGAGENQLEVFAGPASSLYGSGAVGGVIRKRRNEGSSPSTVKDGRSGRASRGEPPWAPHGPAFRLPASPRKGGDRGTAIPGSMDSFTSKPRSGGSAFE